MNLGLYLSRCSGKVDAALDLEELARSFVDRVAVVRVCRSFFDAESLGTIVPDVREHALDAVVLAGNSYGFYDHSISGRYLWDRLEAAGVNRNRIVAANLLQQVALAHADDPVGALMKANALISAAILEAEVRPPAYGAVAEPARSVLILGATKEGLVAAQRLLDLGFAVTMADRGDALERLMSHQALVTTACFVFGHEGAEVLDDASIEDGDGWLGDYHVQISSRQGPRRVQAGGILLAEPAETSWVEELRGHFKVDVDDQGRARSLDPSKHPAETLVRGIMVVPVYGEDEGLLRDKVAAADSAAMALVMKLSKPQVHHHFYTSRVDETRCGGCASCVKTCAFGACAIGDDGLSHVDERRCRGCGKCVVSCPVGARDLISSPHRFLVAAIREFSTCWRHGRKVLGFLCRGCGYPAADRAADVAQSGGPTYPASFLPLRIPCGGRLDTLYVLEAFKQGFDGVSVFRCREGHCHNLLGNVDMDRRVNLLRTVLKARGIDPERLRIVDISPEDGDLFVSSVNGFYADLETMAAATGGAA